MSFRRHPKNPILTRTDLPEICPELVDPSSVFNPGAIRDGDLVRLMLRVQSRARETFLVMAESRDGVDFDVRPEIVRIAGLENVDETVYHVYDPRLTRIDDVLYAMFAVDVEGGCKLGVARSADFSSFELVGLGEQPDIRNGVLFPERFAGRYLRLDRPNRAALDRGTTTGSTIWLSESTDLVRWEPVAPVMDGRWHYWDEWIGAGPPPIKTRDGWLVVYHGVASHLSSGLYQAGVVLLELDDPSRVVARGRQNVLEPRELYEQVGQVPNVVFPSGMVVDATDAHGFAAPEATASLYYGAADTAVCLATATVAELLAACHDS